jgi:soluble lytic murein transglycosylase
MVGNLKQTNLRIPALGLILAVLITSTPSAWAASKKKSTKTNNVKHLKVIRIHQAKELLGRYDKKSVVKTGETSSDVPEFIFKQVKDSLSTHWKKLSRNLAWTIVTQSRKYKLDPIFVMSIIEYESSFNPKSRGDFGEIGLMQIKPDTAKWIAQKYDIPWRGKKSLFDPCFNVKVGTAYLDYLRSRFDDHGRLYLAAYNMGVTNVFRALDEQIWPKDYPLKVMQHYIKFYTELKKQDNLFKAPVVVAAKGLAARAAKSD